MKYLDFITTLKKIKRLKKAHDFIGTYYLKTKLDAYTLYNRLLPQTNLILVI